MKSDSEVMARLVLIVIGLYGFLSWMVYDMLQNGELKLGFSLIGVMVFATLFVIIPAIAERRKSRQEQPPGEK